MTERRIDDRRIRAYHEAGHCWGLWSVRTRFRYTTLRPRTAGFDALTALYRPWAFDEESTLAIVAVCGPFAELIHRSSESADQSPESDAAHLRAVEDGGHHDFQKCRMLLGDPERLNELGSAMRAHWDGISLVADDLLEKSTLSGRQVFEILDETDPGVAGGPVVRPSPPARRHRPQPCCRADRAGR